MTGKIIAIGITLCVSPLSAALADPVYDEPIVIPVQKAAPAPAGVPASAAVMSSGTA